MTDEANELPEKLEARAAVLVAVVFFLVLASVGYLLYARGVFERTQTVVLLADDSEGISVGMDVTFSGFPLGRVNRIELAPDGNARIVVLVPRKDAHWLRTSSVFTMERSLVGGTRIRAYSGILTDPPLPDGAERTVLRGDATAEIPRLMNAARELLANLQAMTVPDSPLNLGLGQVGSAAARLNGPHGALGMLMGNETDARKLITTLNRTNALLARLDGLAARADTQIFGEQGVMPTTRDAVQQLNGLLADARASLKKVDAVLLDAQAIATNTREGSADLAALRAEVDSSLRNVEHLVNQINRRWPFAREAEIRLP
ncbi:MAG TPA: MlaD family protein [Burkholderiaceae bacterium]|nr:MlaD family protein [Burkholderiaceae bacterium]